MTTPGTLKVKMTDNSWVPVAIGATGPMGPSGIPGVTGNNSSTMLSAGVRTTSATAVAIVVVPIPPNTTVLIHANIVARRTGGTAGAADDSAGYQRVCTGRNPTGTVADIIGGSIWTLSTMENQTAWDVTFAVVGPTVEVRVQGAANNTVDWMAFVNTYEVSVVA